MSYGGLHYRLALRYILPLEESLTLSPPTDYFKELSLMLSFFYVLWGLTLQAGPSLYSSAGRIFNA
ncbi:hypothetical protein BFP71_06470 [Roseivirga misakiensis]|uniref:Uncharacterized protein n=1 Tax=Roseivirga misakiensis TaxID=1563681 RepID=A0A1E5T345_9BACT|nr:hypothetical protein BFP71_06470 [Roseivirga misakiensis]